MLLGIQSPLQVAGQVHRRKEQGIMDGICFGDDSGGWYHDNGDLLQMD